MGWCVANPKSPQLPSQTKRPTQTIYNNTFTVENFSRGNWQEEILTTNLTLQRILERIFQAESVDMHIQEDTGKIKYSRTMLSRWRLKMPINAKSTKWQQLKHSFHNSEYRRSQFFYIKA